MKKLLPFLFLLGMVFSFASCGSDDEESTNVPIPQDCPEGDQRPFQILLGNPSGAAPDESMPNNYLMELDEYTISYSRDKAIPNWVSWHLTDEWTTGNGSRQDDFRANPFLPAGWYAPNKNSYDYGVYGFDRGHNCPSADRLCSDGTNSATFFMSNMIPQAPGNNQEIWSRWECYLRYLVSKGNEAYIIMGQYGVGGTSSKGYFEEIIDGANSITVPASVWKVAIIIPKGDDNDLDYIDANSEVLAIDIPNANVVANFNWYDPTFITTVDAIEAQTGYDLFSNLPTNVQNVLENKIHSVDPANNCSF